ncbi:hypothetical protein FRC17_001621 [Serendipita sp. 399]|nr:hypothetical protein FRC17_001621 [Serendipita sp. 399]
MPPAIPDKIPCDREDHLQREIEDLRICLDQEENEESWDKIQRAVARFKAIVRGGGYRHDSFVPSLRPLTRLISTPMLSERGRLSAVAIELVATLASALGKRFDPLVLGFVPTLLKLCQRPNKVVITRAQGCLTTVIKQTRLPSVLPFLRDAAKDKSVTLRVAAVESAYLCISSIEEDKLSNKITDIESIIKTTSRDPNPEVRKHSRVILQEYREKFPEHYATFVSPLTPTTKKYLDIKVDNFTLPKNPLSLNLVSSSGPSSASTSKKVSVPQVAIIKASAPLPAGPPRADQRTTAERETIPFPPRPHSSASIRPKLVQMVSNDPVSNLRAGGTRPLSVDLSDLPNLAGKSERPASILSELNQRLELQRHRSRDALPTPAPATLQHERPQKVPANPEVSIGTNPVPVSDGRHRQRSVSQMSGREEANRAMRAIYGQPPVNHGIVNLGDNLDVQRKPSIVTEAVQPPRPRSALSTTHTHASTKQNTRPVSTAADIVVPVEFVPRATQRPRPHTPNQATTDSARRIIPPPATVTLPNQTPRAAPERPTVVYLPPTEGVSTAQQRPAKTWSLSYQLELLNQRKRAVEAKTVQPESNSDVPEPAADNPAFTPVNAMSEDDQKLLVASPRQTGDVVTVSNEDETPIETPTKVPLSRPHQETLHLEDSAPIPFPISANPQFPPASRPQRVPQMEGNPEQATEVPQATQSKSMTSNDIRQPTNNGTNATKSGPTIAPRSRVVSAASSDTSSIPVRVPSRAGTHQAPKSTGFVPKRIVKSSITQPTKAQAARAQALMDERSAVASKDSATSAAHKAKQPSSSGKPLGASQTKQEAVDGEPSVPVLEDKPARARPASRKPPSTNVSTNTTSQEAEAANVVASKGDLMDGPEAPKEEDLSVIVDVSERTIRMGSPMVSPPHVQGETVPSAIQ